MTLIEFNTYKKDFLTHLKAERRLSTHTLRAYQSDLEQFYNFWQTLITREKMPFGIRQTLDRFFVSLFNKKINKSSIARKISCFHSFEKFVQAQHIELNLNIVRPRLDKKLPIYLSTQELTYLLDHIKQEDLSTSHPYRDKAILELLYATGIRCSELIGISLRDINFPEKTIRICGKGKKERIVLFGTKAYEKINDYLQHERPLSGNHDEKLFLNYRGNSLTTRSVQRIVKTFRKFLKIDRPLTPHKLRHSFATHMLSQGADLRIIQELLGHQTLSSTEIYTHVTPSQLLEMYNTIHPITSIKPKK